MYKRSHKLRELGNVGAVVAASPSIAEAALKLGVNRSTVHRWVTAGKVPVPGGVVRSVASDAAAEVLAGASTPAEWAAKVRALRELDATGSMLLDLAERALGLAIDAQSPLVRLQAMTRVQALVKQLQLDGVPKAGEVPEPAAPVKVQPRRVTHDPRRILSAVK